MIVDVVEEKEVVQRFRRVRVDRVMLLGPFLDDHGCLDYARGYQREISMVYGLYDDFDAAAASRDEMVNGASRDGSWTDFKPNQFRIVRCQEEVLETV